jgi:methionyl-tRNA synthetase
VNSPTPTPPPAAATPASAQVAAPASDVVPNIAYDLFAKLDLRVATVIKAEAHPNADKLLKLTLDDGTPAGRQVCAGIKAWYAPEQLVGKQVIIVANLEPRMLRGEISQGMVLAASDLKDGPDARDVIVLTVDKPVKPGSKAS